MDFPTLEELKQEMIDYHTGNVMMQLENGLINEGQFTELMAEVDSIADMTADEFYAWHREVQRFNTERRMKRE